MRINNKKNVITLGRRERAAWSTRTEGTPESYEARNAVLKRAQDLADASGKTWEVYAPKAAGGWLMEQVTPR